MSFLIDGHNLIPKIPGLSLTALDDELQLIKLLQDFCRVQGKRIDVYFDNAPAGQRGTRKFGAVTAHFVRQGLTADTAIKRKLAMLKGAAKNWTVVSSDREVLAEARSLRAKVLTSESFAQQLSSTEISTPIDSGEAADISLSEADIQDWLNTFNGE